MTTSVLLGEIASVRLGQNVKESESAPDKGIRFIRIKETEAGYFNDTSVLPFAAIEMDKVKAFIEAGDIVLPVRGLRMDAMLIQTANEPLMTTNHMAVIKVRDDNVIPEFCLWYLNSPGGQQALENQRKGATSVPQISSKDLMNVPIPLPTLLIQKQIVEMNSNWLQQKSIYQKLILNGSELTQAACQHLIKGGC